MKKINQQNIDMKAQMSRTIHIQAKIKLFKNSSLSESNVKY